jgi:molecular chaperone DnaK
LKDNGDKIEPGEKSSIENEVANLKKAMEGDDVQAIKHAREKLEQVSHKFAERIYQQTAQQGQPGAQAQPDADNEHHTADQGGEKVYDADYKVVDDEK